MPYLGEDVGLQMRHGLVGCHLGPSLRLAGVPLARNSLEAAGMCELVGSLLFLLCCAGINAIFQEVAGFVALLARTDQAHIRVCA